MAGEPAERRHAQSVALVALTVHVGWQSQTFISADALIRNVRMINAVQCSLFSTLRAYQPNEPGAPIKSRFPSLRTRSISPSGEMVRSIRTNVERYNIDPPLREIMWN